MRTCLLCETVLAGTVDMPKKGTEQLNGDINHCPPVIPANAGIQEGTGFRVKPGMTNRKGLMSLCIIRNQWSSAEKERGFQVSGLIGIDTKPVVGPVSGWVQVGINLVADKLC